MSDKKIQVELTEEEAIDVLSFMVADSTKAKIRAALPPEYPEGTVAWVTTRYDDRTNPVRRILCVFRSGWRIGDSNVDPIGEVLKVEPLRVLADDEIAVKRVEPEGQAPIEYTSTFIRGAAPSSLLCERIVRAYAHALEAEADS